jgi:hypothetical protein
VYSVNNNPKDIDADVLTRWPDLAIAATWHAGGEYIKHLWSDQFRSNLIYGYVNSDNPGFVSGDTFDNTNYIAADLIWTPYKPVTLGVEYLWGRRENKDGASGTDNRYLFSSRYDF